MKPRTLPDYFLKTANHNPETIAHHWDDSFGRQSVTYLQWCREVFAVAEIFKESGCMAGERVVLCLPNRRDLMTLDLAAQFARLVPIIVGDRLLRQKDLFESVRPSLSIISGGEFVKRHDGIVRRMIRQVQQRPSDLPDEKRAIIGLSDMANEIRQDDILAVVLTSGSERPKGVVVSQRNMLLGLDSWLRMWPTTLSSGYSTISYLPQSHIAERVMCHYLPMVRPVTVYVAAQGATSSIRRIRPEVLFAVPRVWTGLLKQSRYVHGGTCNRLRALGLDRLVLGITGGARLAPRVFEGLKALGLPIANAYGLTETSAPIAFSRLTGNSGSSLYPVAGLEVRLSASGQLLVRGPSICYEYLSEAGTARIPDKNGWLHTGDIAELCRDGSLHLIGRKNAKISLDNGLNVNVDVAESEIDSLSEVEKAVIVGEGRAFLFAIVNVAPEHRDTFPRKTVYLKDLVSDSMEHCLSSLVRVVYKLPHWMRPEAYHFVCEDWAKFSLLTPTGKVKRSLVQKHYAKVLNKAYASR